MVLVVHGNHNMRDYSDPGYDYLGELLASRGYVLASVDENFINGRIRNENDGRGWFLLKHVELFKCVLTSRRAILSKEKSTFETSHSSAIREEVRL